MPKHEEKAFPQHAGVFSGLFEPDTPFYLALSALRALGKHAQSLGQRVVTNRLLGRVG